MKPIAIKYGYENYPGDLRLDGMRAAAEFAAETGGDVDSILCRMRLKKTPLPNGRFRHEIIVLDAAVQQPTCWTVASRRAPEGAH